MTSTTTSGAATTAPAPGWERVPWYVAGGIGLAGTAVFHILVAVFRPEYWHTRVWDESYYLHIAQFGYPIHADFTSYSSLPFSPGWPLLLSTFAKLTNLELPVARSLLAGGLSVVTLVLLNRVLGRFSPSASRSLKTLLLFSFWPTALYYRTGYAESLYVVLVMAFFNCILVRRWYLAAAVASLALFTRNPAVVLVGALVFAIIVDALREHSFADAIGPIGKRLVLTLPICALGLAAYAAMVGHATGDPFAFRKAYAAWSPYEFNDWRGVRFETVADVFRWFANPPTLLSMFLFVTTPLIVMAARREMPLELVAFAAGAWLFFLTQDWAAFPFHDQMRWLMVVFPIHYSIIVACDRLPRFQRTAFAGVFLASACVYGLFVVRFVRGEWVS